MCTTLADPTDNHQSCPHRNLLRDNRFGRSPTQSPRWDPRRKRISSSTRSAWSTRTWRSLTRRWFMAMATATASTSTSAGVASAVTATVRAGTCGHAGCLRWPTRARQPGSARDPRPRWFRRARWHCGCRACAPPSAPPDEPSSRRPRARPPSASPSRPRGGCRRPSRSATGTCTARSDRPGGNEPRPRRPECRIPDVDDQVSHHIPGTSRLDDRTVRSRAPPPSWTSIASWSFASARSFLRDSRSGSRAASGSATSTS